MTMTNHLSFFFQSSLTVSEDGRRITYEVVGSSFMFHQVRNMVGALTDVGRGKMSLEQFEALLCGGPRPTFSGAPPQGLTLVWIEHSESAQALPSLDPERQIL